MLLLRILVLHDADGLGVRLNPHPSSLQRGQELAVDVLDLDRQDVAQLRKLTVCDDDGESGRKSVVIADVHRSMYGRIGRDQAWLVNKRGTFRG